jgi:hypothetical protein
MVLRLRELRRSYVVGIGAIATLFGTQVLDRAVLIAGVQMESAVGLSLALGVVFGSWIAVGTGLGYVLTDVIAGSFGPQSTFGYVSGFVLVLLGVAFWNTLERSSPSDSPIRTTLAFVLAAVPAVIGKLSIWAWGAELLARAPFAIAFSRQFPTALLGALTVGLVTHRLLRAIVDRGIIIEDAGKGSYPVFASRRTAIAVAFVLIAWGVAGTLLSVAFQPLQLEYPQILANQFGWLIASLLNVAGPAGRNLQAVIGFIASLLIAAGISWRAPELQ